METALIIGTILSAILGAAGLVYNSRQAKKANEAQAEHDEAMAALNHRYREEEATNSFERQVAFNQFATDETKMREAGLSPALMYGGSISNSTPNISSVGSSQSAGNVGRTPTASDFLGKLDPAEYTEQTIQRMNAKTMREKTLSDIKVNEQNIRESITRELENKRNTAFKKNLERTIFDQEQETLRGLKIGADTAQFDLNFKQDTRDIALEKARLENKELENKVDLLAEQIKTEPVRRAHLAKEMQEIEAATKNYYANSALLQENLKQGQIGRIMKEFGLNSRTLNPAMRNADVFNLPYATQMKAATIALKELGFSEFEATNAVIYYMATDPKEVTPSLINGFSRVFSSMLKK